MSSESSCVSGLLCTFVSSFTAIQMILISGCKEVDLLKVLKSANIVVASQLLPQARPPKVFLSYYLGLARTSSVGSS